MHPHTANAGIAQLVEHNLAKVRVASSSLVSRSKDSGGGALAKRLCSGLQIRLVQFDSGTRLHARVVKSVDTRDLKSLGTYTSVPVRFRPRAPSTKFHQKSTLEYFTFTIPRNSLLVTLCKKCYLTVKP